MPNDTINTIPNTSAARRQSREIPDRGNDYVLEGCDLSIDSNNELTVTSGELVVVDGGTVYFISLVARDGPDTISVPDATSTGVHYDIVPNQVVLSDTEPSAPSLQLGTVDSGAGTTTVANREPAGLGGDVDGKDIEPKSVRTGSVNNRTVYCLSPSDQTDLNDAIGRLPSDGGEVVVAYPETASGTATLSAPVTDQEKNNVTLTGVGDVRLKVADNTQINAIELTGVDNWTIENLEVDGNIANQTDGGNREQQVGIWATDCSDIRIRNNYVHHTQYANIRIRGVDEPVRNVWIHGNKTEKTGDNSSGASDNISLTAGGAGGSSSMRDWFVFNNSALDCGHQAIEISAGVTNGVVSGNYIARAVNNALTVHFGDHVTVANNVIYDTGPQGSTAMDINLSQSVVVGNVVNQTEKGGLRLKDTDLIAVGNYLDGGQLEIQATNALVSNNSITNTSNAAISAQSGSSGMVTENFVHDVNSTGIVDYSGDIQFIGNSVRNWSGFAGIRTQTAGGTFVDNVTINGNNQGLLVESDDVWVNGHISKDNSKEGVEVSGVVDARLFDVYTSGNANGPLADNGTRTAWNGVIELSGAPTGSNYGPADAGIDILDTSTSPATLHKVLQDGSVVAPQ